MCTKFTPGRQLRESMIVRKDLFWDACESSSRRSSLTILRKQTFAIVPNLILFGLVLMVRESVIVGRVEHDQQPRVQGAIVRFQLLQQPTVLTGPLRGAQTKRFAKSDRSKKAVVDPRLEQKERENLT